MRIAVLALCLGLVMAPDANAGAWLRETGKGFAAANVSSNRTRDTRTKIYAEYGLSDQMTLGLDIDYGFEVTGRDEGTGTVFLRFPLGATDQTHRFAWHAGLGTRYQNREVFPAAEVGLSWGRSFKIADHWGWANVDAIVNVSRRPIETRTKVDGTVGLTLNSHVKVMAQVFNTFQGGETYTRVAPSILLTPGNGKTTWQFSAEIPAAGGGGTFLKFGLWRDF